MLTDPKLRNAKPDTKPYKLVDEKGLYIEIKPNGGKTWRYRFRIDGKESTFTIGDYPDVSLAEARDERKKARAMVKEGINPCLQRKIDKVKRTADTQDTLEALALEWSQSKHWSDTTRQKQEAMMRNVIFPCLGALPVKEIMSVHILDMLQYANRKHGPTIAANVRRNLSGIFDRRWVKLIGDPLAGSAGVPPAGGPEARAPRYDQSIEPTSLRSCRVHAQGRTQPHRRLKRQRPVVIEH